MPMPSIVPATMQLLLKYWGVLLVFLAWAVLVRVTGLNTIVLPGPVAVIGDLIGNPAVYVLTGGRTLALAVLGLACGATVGILLAALCWFSIVMRGMLTPVGLMLSSVPVVAIIPIIVRIFGNGLPTILGIVAVITFFPAFVFTSSGLANVPAGSRDLFSVLGAGKIHRFRLLALPAAVPSILVALKVCGPSAMLAAMTAEFLIGDDGLGYLLRVAASKFQIERVFGAALLSAVFAIAMTVLLQAIEASLGKRWL